MKLSLRNYFLTGLIILVPIAITFWITYSLLLWLDQIFFFEVWLGISVPGLGFFLALLLILITGILGKNVLGNWFVNQLSLALNHIPFIGTIYGSLRQIMNSVMNTSGNRFGRAVLVEFPKENSWTIGFVTAMEAPKPVRRQFDQKMACVFVPTTPNPTSGFFFFVPMDKIKILDISVDEAFKIVVSLGLASASSDLPEFASAAPPSKESSEK